MKVLNRIITILCTVMLLISGMCVFADNSDPVVSLSYLEQVFAPAFKKEVSADMSYKLVTVKAGKAFIGSEGCEFILRSGAASSIVSKNGGICDTTDGRDIGTSEAIPSNHLLIIPRDDWRGFTAVTDVMIMVKGYYSIN